jgi:hypothetical protein
MWPETDDIPPMGDEPEPPPFAVAAPLDEESFAVWAPGRMMRPMERLVNDAFHRAMRPVAIPHPKTAHDFDYDPSGIGIDCCEEARDLSCGNLRYSWLLGTCLECGSTEWTAQPRGWSGPVRPPFKRPPKQTHEEYLAELKGHIRSCEKRLRNRYPHGCRGCWDGYMEELDCVVHHVYYAGTPISTAEHLRLEKELD